MQRGEKNNVCVFVRIAIIICSALGRDFLKENILAIKIVLKTTYDLDHACTKAKTDHLNQLGLFDGKNEGLAMTKYSDISNHK